MRAPLASILEKVRLQLELDQERGVAALPLRVCASSGARTAGD